MTFPVSKFTDIVQDKSGGNQKLPQELFLTKGDYPVVDQGKKFIAGYIKDKDYLVKSTDLPVIVFGDHTKAIKFIDFPFAMGADGVKVLKPKAECDTKYLYHYLRYAKIPDAGYSRHYKFLKELEIPLPSLSEQRRIASILDQADELRQKRQQAIEKLDQLLQAIFIDMFGDPITNPKNWDVEPLKNNILHANNGLSRRRKELENVGQIVLRLQDVHYDGIHFDKDLNRIPLDDSEKKRFSVDIDDILFIRVNGNPDYVGRSAVFTGFKEPVFHNDHLIRLKLNKKYNPQFLSYCFNSRAGRKIISKQIKTSAGQHTVSQGGIEVMNFYVPPIELQEKWTNSFIKVEEQKKKLYKQLDIQNQLFKSLQNQAFSGNL